MSCKVLNLGCGHRKVEGGVNVDITDRTNPDVMHDLNIRPWPFADNTFSEVLAYDVIEHLDDVIGTMEEIHRVCQDRAVVRITVPHYSSPNAFRDPTHRHYFGFFSFHYVTGEHKFGFYSARRFRRRVVQMNFHTSLVNKIVWRLANRFPDCYERRWAWMFPAWFMYYELEVAKAITAEVAA